MQDDGAAHAAREGGREGGRRGGGIASEPCTLSKEGKAEAEAKGGLTELADAALRSLALRPFHPRRYARYAVTAFARRKKLRMRWTCIGHGHEKSVFYGGARRGKHL